WRARSMRSTAASSARCRWTAGCRVRGSRRCSTSPTAWSPGAGSSCSPPDWCRS
ncbi:MAG: Transcriptional regulator, AsnC family, partial [uncultured Pseudonocardia sp.]